MTLGTLIVICFIAATLGFVSVCLHRGNDEITRIDHWMIRSFIIFAVMMGFILLSSVLSLYEFIQKCNEILMIKVF